MTDSVKAAESITCWCWWSCLLCPTSHLFWTVFRADWFTPGVNEVSSAQTVWCCLVCTVRTHKPFITIDFSTIQSSRLGVCLVSVISCVYHLSLEYEILVGRAINQIFRQLLKGIFI